MFGLSESYLWSVVLVYLFLAAVLLQFLKGERVLAPENGIHIGLARYVLDVAAAHAVALCEQPCIGLLDVGYQGLPDMLTRLHGGRSELHLVEEAALEGIVKSRGQVGGTYHDTVQSLHLLQDDVLDALLHPVHSVGASVSRPLAEDSVALVEEENRRYMAVRYERAVLVEDGLDAFLALTDILVPDGADVHLHDDAPVILAS